MDYIDEVRSRGLNDLQLDEVKEGLKTLNIEQVEYYASKKYDHLQMREIRLAFEHGLSENQIDLFAKYPEEYSYNAMNNARIKLENENMIDEQAKVKVRSKQLKNGLLFVVIILVVAVIGVCGTVLKYYVNEKNQSLEITLYADTIHLNYGDTFNPSEYIESYTKADNVELSVPEPIDTHQLGTFTITYSLRNHIKTVKKEAQVIVVDLEKPVITLSNQEVTLTRSQDTFSCKAYLSSAIDNVDGDITGKVECSSVDTNKDTQTVKYTVKDSSGNEGEKELKLTFKDPPEPEKVIVYQDSGSNSTAGSYSAPATSGGSNQTYSAPAQPVQHGTQYFMFSDGYNMDSGYQACVVAGSSYGTYSCSPVQEDGIYTGYVLNY